MYWTTEVIPNAVLKSLQEAHSIPENLSVLFAWSYEDMPVDGAFCEDEDVQWVKDQLAEGNEAAWFCARVTVTDGDASGEDYLGGCSYRSFAEFMNPGDCFSDMVSQAFDAFQVECDRLRLKYGTTEAA
jgi:hypothetical protein